MNQLVGTPEQATFMQNAWRMVLGRLADAVPGLGAPGSVEPDRRTRPRPARPKHPRT